MQFVLVRHAQPAWVDGGINRDDPRLTDLGRRQALLTAASLAGETFDEVWVSPARRARETAAPFLELTGMQAAVHDFLLEIRNPDWEGTDHDALEIFAAHRRRHPEDQWEGLDGGEAVSDFRDRVHTGLTHTLAAMGVAPTPDPLPTWQVEEPGKRIVVFAHAGTNSMVLSALLGVAAVPWEWERFVTWHASISTATAIDMGDDYAFSLVRLSETRHLPPELVTR
ncbi:MAG: histidine phosphatase family protein [Acidimicrobiales bacterium]|nr:histidine phosphatase family protein [Acidimicrobiales bacterium]